jgi:ribonuclease HI
MSTGSLEEPSRVSHKAASGPYYAVKVGRIPGIYRTWEECQKQISEFKGAKYKKFGSATQAQTFIDGQLDVIPLKLTPKLSLAIFSRDNDYNPGNWIRLEDEYYIFTDGSFHSSSKHSGVAVFFGTSALNIAEYYEGLTNNQCELLAILYSLQAIIKYYNHLANKTVNIVSDSEYSINCLTKWLANWKSNDWKTKTGEEVKNRQILSNCDKCIEHLRKLNMETHKNVHLKFLHTRSHLDPPNVSPSSLEYIIWQGNHFADLIANKKIA